MNVSLGPSYVVLKLLCALGTHGGFIKTQMSWSHLQSFCFTEDGIKLENCLFNKFQDDGEDHILRSIHVNSTRKSGFNASFLNMNRQKKISIYFVIMVGGTSTMKERKEQKYEKK